MYSDFGPLAKNLKRASMFAAKSISKAVPKQEPCRAELNGQLHAFEQLSGELIRTTVLRCLPDETSEILLEIFLK